MKTQNTDCGLRSAGLLRSAPRSTLHAPRAERGFTMIEIAISLAIIGFALVAIIGILPTSMSTQKNNRQETVINQDATVLLDAIRNGAQGMDDLTNYVAAISIVRTIYGATGAPNGSPIPNGSNWYSYSSSTTSLLLTNGLHIIGLLSTPKYIALSPQHLPYTGIPTYLSNHVVAYMRSMSGPASEKTPASYSTAVNPVQDMTFGLGFNYRLVSDVIPYFGYDANGYPLSVGTPAGARGYGTNYSIFSENLKTNLHDVRLTFRWPLQPNGSAGSGYQVFRAAAVGDLIWMNEFDPRGSLPAATNLASIPLPAWPTELFFLQPRTFMQAHMP